MKTSPLRTPPLRTLRLLIAEDDRQVAEIQRRFIERMTAIDLVGIAHTLADTRDQIEVLSPDLVLLDVHFPDGNGLELLRELRACSRHTDIILITAAREVNTVRSALHGGVFDYILKPLVYERLEEALNQFRAHLDTLDGRQNLAQKEVDQLLPRGHADSSGDAPARLPKGIDALTLDKIRQVVQQGDWSADAVGQQIGASRTTARRYLEFMISSGELTAEVSYGTVGRPERRYRRLDD